MISSSLYIGLLHAASVSLIFGKSPLISLDMRITLNQDLFTSLAFAPTLPLSLATAEEFECVTNATRPDYVKSH